MKGDSSESPLPPPPDFGIAFLSVTDTIRSRGVVHAAPAVNTAQRNGCTLAELRDVVLYYDFRKCFDAAQLCHRIKHSVPQQPPDDGWPVRNAPKETRSQAAKIEQEAAQAENRIVKDGRSKGATDDAIRKKIRDHFEATGLPLK